ncbi:alpha-hydroxy-acid oxidizing protein [Pseudolysinimonas sp.]|uniref:alpha-hydroxy-acid oxidizing protein n=1 Tax=Pseudolysinimonas sp. TaxID=2680009 RepID=UPI003F7DB2F2
MTAAGEDRVAGIGRRTQSDVFRAGVSGDRPRIPVRWPDLVEAARRRLGPDAWAYLAGASGTETTAAANAAAFDRYRIVPRMLRDTSGRDLSVELLGRRYPTPLLAAPVGVLELAHRDADLAIARAAGTFGIPTALSTQASIAMETVAADPGRHDGPLWYQLYWASDDELVESLVTRAEAAGAEVLVVTLDTGQLGWRPRDLDRAFLPFIHGMGIAQYTSDPVFRRLAASRAAERSTARVTTAAIRTLLDLRRRGVSPAEVQTFLDVFSRSDLTWSHLSWLRERTRLPIMLKGIQHPDDARRALDAGMDGVWVSNHAGRQVDGAVGSLDALPRVADAVAGRAPIVFDSGVRTGADVLRALALGADAVAVAHPWIYGMAIAGEAGAREALRNLLAEFDLALGLSGHASVAGLDRDALEPAGGTT